MNSLTIMTSILVILLVFALIMLFQSGPPQKDVSEITYSQFVRSEKDIRDVTIPGSDATGHMVDNRRFLTRLPADPSIATKLAEAGVSVSIGVADDQSFSWTSVLIGVLSLAISLFWLVPLFRIAKALERNAPQCQVTSGRVER